MKHALLLALLALPLPAAAWDQTFGVFLDDRRIGTISHEGSGDAQRMETNLDNTPLGLAEGVFEGTSRPARTEAGAIVRQYLGIGKGRTISVLFDGDRAIDTVVDPVSEATDLSDPTVVKPGVIDPVQTIGRILGATDCPEPFSYYDGRRTIDVATISREEADGTISCRLSYQVVQGPGHLSPFRFRSLDVRLYLGGGRLASATISAGPFTLRLQR